MQPRLVTLIFHRKNGFTIKKKKKKYHLVSLQKDIQNCKIMYLLLRVVDILVFKAVQGKLRHVSIVLIEGKLKILVTSH